MSEISSVSLGQGGTNPVNRPSGAAAYQRNGVHSEPKSGATAGDRVDLSDHARLIAQLRALPEVRADLVERAQQAIDDPEYLTDERLNTAIDRLLEELVAGESA